MRRFFLVAFGVFISSISLATVFPFTWQPALAACFLAFAFGVLARARRSRRFLSAAVLVLVPALVFTRFSFVERAAPDAFLPLFETKIALEGTVVADPDLRETTQRVTVALEHNGKMMRTIAVAALYPEFRYGERVRVEGKLEAPEPFATDGGRTFAYDTFLAKDGIFGLVPFARITTLADTGWRYAPRAYLFDGKHAFTDALALALPEPAASLAAGIITGGKQGLGEELLDDFTVSGLLPVVVLSGYNVMIVAEGVLAAFGFLPKRLALFLAGNAILAFVLAAGAGSSATRAGLMAGLGLSARASGRTYHALLALLFVLAGMLIHNPLLLVHDPGLQFSFMATLGLIAGVPRIEPCLSRVRPAFLREVIASTVAAQLFVLPILLYQTGNLSLVALPANVIVLPVIPLAMLMSAIAGGIALIVPPLAPVAGLPAYALLAYVIAIAEWSARLRAARVIVPAFPFWVAVALYCALAFLMLRMQRKAVAPRTGSDGSRAANWRA
ncbi:MAG TPA: ComEC/Rec2 family competence protein [Candidatus Paceibacterota bacterium]|nr:ComEC/Rec2 family competence protein [Candidatus Paceibacterota bacterium]